MIDRLKFSVVTTFFFSLSIHACTQDHRPIQLIVRGDDMGSSHSANVAMIEAFKDGIERSAEVIVNSPWFPEAVKLLNENPKLDVGVHLALTSEWDNIKWRPLTRCSTLIDENGYFRPFVFRHPAYFGKSIEENPYDLLEIENELRAQIAMAKRNIPHLSHYSIHMGIDRLPGVKNIIVKLAEEFDISVDLEKLGVMILPSGRPSKSVHDKRRSILEMISSLKPGNKYLYLDHPAVDSPELRAIFHKGYQDVAQDRSAVLKIWTDPDIQVVLRKRKVQLVSYSDIAKQQTLTRSIFFNILRKEAHVGKFCAISV